MEAKEKAKELFDKYKEQMIENEAYFVNSGAKHCALIAVEEIRDNLPLITDIQQYWINVKFEIEKIII